MDIGGDILAFDSALASVTFTGHGGSVVIIAGHGPAKEDQARPSNGVYRRYKKTYFIPQATATPLIKDTILDSDGLWTILKLSPGPLGGPWFCSCVCLNLNGWLSDTVTIYRPVYTTNEYADKIKGRVAVMTMAARIQPIGKKETVVNGKTTFKDNYEVYVDLDLDPATVNSTVVCGSDEYVIEDVQSRATLEDFTVLKVYKLR